MRFESHKDFISVAEHESMLSWFDINKDNRSVFGRSRLMDVTDAHKFRVTTRFSKNVEFPAVLETVFKRIQALHGFEKYERAINGGLVAVITKPKGATCLHTDTNYAGTGMVEATYNLLVQAPESGGALHLGEDLPEKKQVERELHCYAATAHPHFVSTVCGGKDRYLLIYRLNIPLHLWEGE